MPAPIAAVLAAAMMAAQAITTGQEQNRQAKRSRELQGEIDRGEGISKAEEKLFTDAQRQATLRAAAQATQSQSDYERMAAASGGAYGGAGLSQLRKEKDTQLGRSTQEAGLTVGLAKAQANADALAQKRAEVQGVEATRASLRQAQVSSATKGLAQIAGTVGQAAAYEKQAPSGLWGKENYSNAQRAAMTPDAAMVGTDAQGRMARYTPSTDKSTEFQGASEMDELARTPGSYPSAQGYDYRMATAGGNVTPEAASAVLSDPAQFQAVVDAVRKDYPGMTEEQIRAEVMRMIQFSGGK